MDTDGIDKKLVQYAYKLPTLTHEQEIKIGERIKKSNGADTDAIAALVKSHLRYAISIARQFQSYGLPINDLIQEGFCGLTIAAARFDPHKGARFATYAQWWINAMIAEYILKNWSLVKIGSSRAQKTLFFNIRKLRNQYENNETSGGNLTDETIGHIAQKLNVEPQDVRNMEQRILHGRDYSLSAPSNNEDENSETREQQLESTSPNPEEIIMHERQTNRYKDIIDQAIQTLPEREQIIVRARLLSEEKSTLEDLGQKLNVSKERIRQLEVRAMRQIEDWIHQHISDKSDLFNN